MIKWIKRIDKNIFFLLISLIITYIIATWNIKGTSSIAVYGDEFGYWQGAAFFLGIDWSEVVSKNAYYGCGYGIFLAPIMQIWKYDSSIMLQMAIRMQAIILVICLIIAYQCIGMITDKINNISRVLVASLVIWYPYNFLFVNVTMCESILNFCIWVLFYLIMKYVHLKNNIFLYLTIPITAYMYLVHSRSLSAIFTIFMVIFIVAVTSEKSTINKKNAIILFVLLCVFLIVALYIKNMYIEFEYSKATVEAVDSNNMKGQVGKINRIFASFSGFQELIYSLLGKLFYSTVGTFYLLPLGLFYSFINVVEGWKTRKVEDKLHYILLLLLFLSAWIIGAAFTASNSIGTRADVLIYGRYIEYVFGPIMLIGAINIIEQKTTSKMLFTCIFVTQLLALFIGTIIKEGSSLSNMWVNCAAISHFFYLAKDNKEAIWLATIVSSIFPFVVCVIKSKRQNFGYLKVVLLLTVIGIYWCRQSVLNWQDQIVEWRNEIYTSQNEILNIIDTDKFALYDAEFAGFFQFLRVDAQVLSFDSIEECMEGTDINFIISDSDCDMKDWIVENAIIIKDNGSYILWNVN